ncbi:MAG: hypothetical protein KDB27_09160, partial [Planctomycetales bacterium]|nr:hypothetical protein [Planctomycetales bacterium]
MSHKRNKHAAAFESLENRKLLAGDFAIGDANMDYYVDAADLIQVIKFGKFRSDEAATWEEGDWTNDGVFDADDLRGFTRSGHLYLLDGPYDDRAGEPANRLQPIHTSGEPDVTLFYFTEDGTLTAIASDSSKLGALHIVSKSESLSGQRGPNRPYDFSRENEQFVVEFLGGSWIENPGLLPIGWTREQILSDLL